ncbi:MAG: FAD-binding oxidoreductase [bacterium]|nr:FAD-binding oxidoreductase [bacterium]
MNNIQFYKVLITEVIEEAPSVKRFILKFEQEVAFKPGQFVILKFEGLQHQFDTRSYSIAGQINSNCLEICVVFKEDGAATPLLFEHKIGDTLLSSLPEGRFVLQEEPIQKNLFFICTGTGVAPFRCMIKELLLNRKHALPIHLFFGCRKMEDLLYRSEFEELAMEYPNFSYHPVLSREQWDGNTGYVHPHYLKMLETTKDALFYLCGWTEMLKETRDNIKNLGYTRQDIKVEFYD